MGRAQLAIRLQREAEAVEALTRVVRLQEQACVQPTDHIRGLQLCLATLPARHPPPRHTLLPSTSFQTTKPLQAKSTSSSFLLRRPES